MSSRTIKTIYTDGACSGNPGPGGWGTVVYFTDGSVHELGGGEAQTTNNRMEMQAAIAALEFVLGHPQSDPITLYTDSEYVKNGITQWVKGWKRKGWKTSAGKAVLNQDLWEMIDHLTTRVNQQLSTPLKWEYVKGHAGNEGNERCDQIARAYATGRVPVLRQRSLSDLTPVLEAATVSASQKEDLLELHASDPSTLFKTSSTDATFDAKTTEAIIAEEIESSFMASDPVPCNPVMVDSIPSPSSDASDLPREVRVAQLRNLVETLRMADEVASQGYLITSSELADLMDVNASAVTSRGDNWVWRNWVVSRVRREGNQILWQLERVD